MSDSGDTQLQIRTATAADTAAIAALWSQAGVGAGSPTDGQEIRQRLDTVDDFFIVGVLDGTIVASVMGCYDGHRGHIKRVAVATNVGGQGFGQAMMSEVEHRFRTAGVLGLRLAVWDENTKGLEFWQRAGWTDLTDIHYMTKDLS